MTRRGTNISLKSYEDIFTTEEKRQETGEQVVMIPVNQIHEFKNHPFKVLDDEDMRKTVDSIREYGVLVPVIIRPDGNGEYEMISGHRRRYASIMAGKKEVPAIIREMDDDTATILMVDSNLQREHILPSERAKAYKMKMEALKHQGKRTDLTSCQVGTRLRADEELAKQTGESARTVQRFVRLNNLIPELLDLVDEKKITISMAVDMSYFNEEVQGWLLDYYKSNGKITLKQMAALKELQNLSNITKYTFTATLNGALPEGKGNGRVNLSERKLNKYFPARMTAKERERIIIELLGKWKAEKDNK